MTISDKIKILREQKNLSLEKFSEKIGVKANTVWRWETGKATPQTQALQKIAKVFNIPLSELLDEQNENITQEKLQVQKIKKLNDKDSSKTIIGWTDNIYVVNHNGLSVQLPVTPENTAIVRQILHKMMDDVAQSAVIGNTINGNNNNNQLGSIIHNSTISKEEK